MRRVVRLDPEAEAELQEAASCYAARSKAASRRFLKQVLALARVIGDAPDRFPRLVDPRTERPVHRALVPGFPYALVFLAADDRVHILAVAHTRRDPGYWIHRIG